MANQATQLNGNQHQRTNDVKYDNSIGQGPLPFCRFGVKKRVGGNDATAATYTLHKEAQDEARVMIERQLGRVVILGKRKKNGSQGLE